MANPGDNMPLRTVLALIKELEAMKSNLALNNKAIKTGWKDPAKEWKSRGGAFFLKHLEEDRDTHLGRGGVSSPGPAVGQPEGGWGSVLRLHATTPLTAAMENPAAFLLEISTRSRSSQEAWETLRYLQGNTILKSRIPSTLRQKFSSWFHAA